MRLKRKRESLPRARRRAASQPTDSLYGWIETGLVGVGQNVSFARRGAGVAALDEAEHGLLVLVEVCRELRARLHS